MTTRVIQRTPDIEMALRMKRPSPCACEITGAGWGSLYPRETIGSVWGQETREEYNQTPVISTNQWGDTYLELPDRKTAYQIGFIGYLPGMWGYEPQPGFLLGIPFGDDLSGLKWSWSTTILNQYEDWTEGGWKGLEISQDGLYLSVYVWPGGLNVSGGGYYGGGRYIPVIRLDATATCSDGTSASIWAEFGIQNILS